MAVRSLTPKPNLGGSSIVAAQNKRRAELAAYGLCGPCSRAITLAGFTGRPVLCFDDEGKIDLGEYQRR